MIVVVLLRGINVGGRNRLSMATLTTLLENEGWSDVATYIQSGNVVARREGRLKKTDAAVIADALEAAAGFRPDVFLCSAQDFRSWADASPYKDKDPGHWHLSLAHQAPTSPDKKRLEELRADSENFAMKGSAFYLYAPKGIGRSRLATGIEKALGESVTARNGKTVAAILKLIDRCEGEPS